MQLIDTHCHLQFRQMGNVSEVLSEAAEVGVDTVICPSTTLADSKEAVAIARRHDNVWAAVGVHPHDADNFVTDTGQAQQMIELLRLPEVVAMGEIGLDYYKNYCPVDTQKRAFAQLLEIGIATDKPFIFHVRDAFSDFFEIIDRYPGIRGVVHSFSATSSELVEVTKRGLFVGLNGIMTFTKDDSQLEAAKQVPLRLLLIETDAPFLTPTPFRGKINSAKHVRVVAEFLGNLRDEPMDVLAAATTRNAEALFRINVKK